MVLNCSLPFVMNSNCYHVQICFVRSEGSSARNVQKAKVQGQKVRIAFKTDNNYTSNFVIRRLMIEVRSNQGAIIIKHLCASENHCRKSKNTSNNIQCIFHCSVFTFEMSTCSNSSKLVLNSAAAAFVANQKSQTLDLRQSQDQSTS